jgi:hypothetical protein
MWVGLQKLLGVMYSSRELNSTEKNPQLVQWSSHGTLLLLRLLSLSLSPLVSSERVCYYETLLPSLFPSLSLQQRIHTHTTRFNKSNIMT